MIKEVPYNGYSANPSDYEAPDGDLTTSLNLIPEDGQLKPLFQPSVVCTLPAYCKFVFIHKTATFTHYVAIDEINRTIYWIDQNDASGSIAREFDHRLQYPMGEIVYHGSTCYSINDYHPTGTLFSDSNYSVLSDTYPMLSLLYGYASSLTIHQVNAIGNTLFLLTNDGVYYFLWKNASYQFLGNHIPELPISFGLQATPKVQSGGTLFDNHENRGATHLPTAENPKVYFYHKCTTGIQYEYWYNQVKELSDACLGVVNNFIAREATQKGKFIFPFLVRYAFRLYDGSIVMHSAPALMITSSGLTPQVYITGHTTATNENGTEYLESVSFSVAALVCDLDYACLDSNSLSSLRDWDDIVKSVDIFISAPFYTYDQSESAIIDGFMYKDSFNDEYTVSLVTGVGDTGTPFDYPMPPQFFYRKTNVPHLLFSSVPTCRVILPSHSDEDVINSIKDCSSFYFLKSIKLSDIQTDRTKIEISEDYLEALVTREQMTDDYDSHDTLVPSLSKTYNSRLNLANINKILSLPFNPATQVPFCNSGAQTYHYNMNTETYYYNTTGNKEISIYVTVQQDGKSIVMQSPVSQILSTSTPFVYFFYPNSNAEKAVLVVKDTSTSPETISVKTINLERHLTLNGVVFFSGWNSVLPSDSIPSITNDRIVSLPNKLYTSEINNPFLFPATGITTIGTGTILGISSAAKALSQGQFGKFPLYAFCSDGVWALEVSDSGTFSARQPITRDVCINSDSITQLDNAVIFASDRGLMLIQGSETSCITDSIASEQPFNVLSLSHVSDLHTLLGHSSDSCLPTQPFLTFLQNARLIYDYVHQHLIVFNTSYSYSYVYSLKSKRWGMMFSQLNAALNSYPDALAMAPSNKLVSFSGTDETVCKGLLITRPLKLDSHDVLKSVHTLIQRGIFQKGDVNTLLYGSRDLYSWHLIASSTSHSIRNLHGSPYKYFRIASVASLTAGKSLSGVSIELTLRNTNKLI